MWRGCPPFHSYIPRGDGACYVVDGVRGIVQTRLPPGFGRCFSGIELNYPFSTRGAVYDLFLFHSPAPPSSTHSGSCGQG